MSWEEAYTASTSQPAIALHLTEEGWSDALVVESEGHPDECYVARLENEGLLVPVAQVSAHLQAIGIDPHAGWG